eukprot:1160101-Pelagomonas_calceolata.AAC.9
METVLPGEREKVNGTSQRPHAQRGLLRILYIICNAQSNEPLMEDQTPTQDAIARWAGPLPCCASGQRKGQRKSAKCPSSPTLTAPSCFIP